MAETATAPAAPTSTPGNLQASDYVHLHNHTQFSLLDGLTRVPDLIEYVKETGMQSVAMTDHGTLSGAIEFYKEATKNDVKPIIGIETYVAARKHTDKDPQKDKNRFHLILLAMNHKGYQNLMQLSTIANLHGFYYYPRIDHELLEQYNEGIIALSACMGSEIGTRIRDDQYDQAKEIAEWYKSVFGDRYYLEIQDHGHPDNPLHSEEQQRVNEGVLKLSKELDIPAVVTCDAHYLKHEDQDAHEILLCVGTGSYLSDEKRMSLKDYPLHVEAPAELIKRWGTDHPEVITNTKVIADRCNLEIELGGILIPKFPVPEGETEKSYLDRLVMWGLAWRYGTKPDGSRFTEEEAGELSPQEARAVTPANVLERADYELGVIAQMGFNGYFLIIADFMNWGKDQGIVFGPGRGSAAGSIISYSLKITELDPLHYDLLFERFLNPDRISMPDVDIDIQDTRRDEVIQYCADKYGSERVANIVTFGRMFARNAVRDVARVLQVPYGDADRLAKMIPAPVQGRHIPLKVSLAKDPELKREYDENPASREVLEQALRLEGTVRSHGIHACGVVIAPDDIVKFAPLEIAQKGVISTQYPKDPVEELGLLKMDFLGLSNLSIMNTALEIIAREYGVTDIDINELPLDDPKTFKLLQRGDTTGVFQFESSGMKRYLRELKATEFDDVIAMGALYRPGPLSAGLTDSFIKRKNGLEAIEYAHPLMKPALETTFGVLVYQEQVMRISRDVCGFTGGEADTLRKAIGKKKKDVMEKMRVKFIDGAVANGVPRNVIEKFWKDLLGFADYCFNKSHSACYGMISYQTAYLKAHYPAAFMAALMSSDYDDIDRLAIEITECKKMGIAVTPPDVNESVHDFTVVPAENKIRFGMNAVKNVGTGAVDEILRAREEGPFKDLEDFFTRVNVRIVNRKTLEALIKSGGFDRFGQRNVLLHNLDTLLAFAQRMQKDRTSGQTDLFGNAIEDEALKVSLKLDETAPKIDQHEQLKWERDLLGLYLSRHPLELYESFLQEQTVPLKTIKPEHDGKPVNIGGAVTDTREITTKNGQKMAFIKIEDQFGEVECIVFPNGYQRTLGLWERDRVVLVRGKVNGKDRDGNIGEEVKIMVDDAREITPDQGQSYQTTGRKQPELKIPRKTKTLASRVAAAKSSVTSAPVTAAGPQRIYVRLASTEDQSKLMTLKQTIDEFAGTTEVVLVLGTATQRQAIKLPGGVREDCISKLSELVGADNVKLH